MRFPRLFMWCMLATIFGLSGCQSHSQSESKHPTAWLKVGTKVALPSPGITPEIHSQQMLTGHFQGKSQSLLVMLNADQNKLTLAGLSPVGIRLFLLTYDQQGVHSEQSIVIPHLPPANQVLADVMLSFYPLDRWQKQLPKGWSLVDDGLVRRLLDDKQTVVTQIHYLQRNGQRLPISIEQQAFHYQITLQYLSN